MTPRKHAELIKLWADGATIQVMCKTNKKWLDLIYAPNWEDETEYRVKPKPDVVTVARVQHINGQTEWRNLFDHDIGGKVQFTFDGETGKLKAVKLHNG